VSPAAIRIGARARVAIFGDALHGRVSFGPGVKWRVLSRTPTSIVAEVTAQDGATNGHVAVRVGSASAVDQFAVYDRVDRLVVAPQLGIARVGGGKVDPVTAQFEATAYLDLQGPDGGTTAVRLGDLPVSWAVEPYNDEAREAQDVKYAGRIDDTGRFLPAGGGPNLERKYSANNVGDLAVTATLADANLPAVVGRAHLIVTVQRWNSPPIL
jgi:quinohemoprotein amine dehydrogenase